MRIGQTKLMSILESSTDTIISILISVGATYLIFPIFIGQTFPLITNIWIVTSFTVIGLIRKYICRRIFNYFHIKGF